MEHCLLVRKNENSVDLVEVCEEMTEGGTIRHITWADTKDGKTLWRGTTSMRPENTLLEYVANRVRHGYFVAGCFSQ